MSTTETTAAPKSTATSALDAVYESIIVTADPENRYSAQADGPVLSGLAQLVATLEPLARREAADKRAAAAEAEIASNAIPRYI